ncbi:hypothetical protein RB195_006108 [Necator americanus]|uniref:Endonuclease/exonuclease/phosphatase domain-containing protein n=1 Tax=Necator americanus TaxID=51031 RepID=A0ABR1BQZ3_NECAM
MELASSSTRVWQRTLTLSNNLRPESDVCFVFVAYAPTSSYEKEEFEASYMDLEKFYREDHAFYKVIIGDFNAKVGPRRTPEELHIGTHGFQWNN